MKFLITGVAGFIGFHVCLRLLNEGHYIYGIDNLNNYYDVNLKKNRLKQLQHKKNFKFKKIDISNNNFVNKVYPFIKDIKIIIHLAAQAGVRYSLTHPYKYIKSNIEAQVSILELAKKIKNFKHFIYASSSSVYGFNKKIPFAVTDRVDEPASLYGATKRSGELISNSYSRMFNINCSGLRFFSVYGPWGRPDMAAYIFTRSLFENKKINLFNYGKMERDFTYVDDIVDGIVSLIKSNKSKKKIQHKIYNLGNNKPEPLLKLLKLLEKYTEKKAKKQKTKMQLGDVRYTYANIKESKKDFKFYPKVKIEEGLSKFVDWFKIYHKIS